MWKEIISCARKSFQLEGKNFLCRDIISCGRKSFPAEHHGIRNEAKAWFQSYLFKREQFVTINEINLDNKLGLNWAKLSTRFAS